MLNGYMKFITPGTQSTSAKTGLLGSSMQSAEDENTVILRAFNRSVPAQSEELYNIILERINNSKYSNTNSSASSVSSADEILKYKKLLDEGIITQEES